MGRFEPFDALGACHGCDRGWDARPNDLLRSTVHFLKEIAMRTRMRLRVGRGGTLLVAMIMATSAVPAAVLPTMAAADDGPSSPLPAVPSVPVTQQSMAGHGPDETSQRALRGDQPAGANSKPGTGNHTATSLSPSATWAVAGQTGDFSWSYPLRVPPAPGGLAPQLALSYSSSAVDGLTSTTNNQASWIGDGWNLWPGFIERSYQSCAEDVGGAGEKPGDLCWRSENGTMSLNGAGGKLIKDDGGRGWRLKNDDGSRIEPITATGNGANNSEAWKVTTTDGTQYFFGTRAEAKSVWTVPVFGDDQDEPCHGPTFATSWCTQAYRWNLDRVIDRHGNLLDYFYETETNLYGRNKNTATSSYVRGGWLARIDYGLRADAAVAASARVQFEVTDRCVPGSDCTLSKPDNLPDVPLNLKCDGSTCVNLWSPTFWTTKRLGRITTEVLRGAEFAPVDSWTLRHELPDPGDGEKAALWLKGITHTGRVGGELSLPEVTFDGARKPNRVHGVDGYAALIRFRMNAVVSEAGGITSISYAEPECVHGSHMPANPESNTMRCFPVRWTPPGAPERTDYFHKYVVSAVSSSDQVVGSIAQVVGYEYLDGAAWHWDDSEMVGDDRKTWNEFRGFGRVRIRTGSGYDGPKTLTENVYYRGMHGDRLPTGTRTASVTDSAGGTAADEDWLQGFTRESITYNGDGGEVIGKTITEPAWQGPTAVRGPFKAYIVRPGVHRGYTALEGGAWRITRSEKAYDDRGLTTQVNDLGDLDTAADDRCTRTTYLRNLDRWLLSYPARVETVSVDCGRTPTFPDNAVADTRTSYDQQGADAPPTVGDPTRVEMARSHPATGPEYVTVATSRFDVLGRVREASDALGRTTKTGYVPETGGPVTQLTTTTPPTAASPTGMATSTALEPAWGLPTLVTDPNGRKTETAYDALGRSTEVWLADRKRAERMSGNLQFSYLFRNDGPNVVTTTSIGPNGNYSSTREIYDGLLRKRQIQAPAAGGGRLLTDTRYDSHGRVVKLTQPYFNDAPIDDGLWFPTDADVPGLTEYRFDGVGRVTSQVFRGGNETWTTTNTYSGDRVRIVPPQGGTTTTTISNARGQITEFQQHTPTGVDTTRYVYTPAGNLERVTDPGGNVWQYTYDLRGRKLTETDPDRGTTTYGYDDADQLSSTTDSRNITLAYAYDTLGRKKEVHLGSLTGARLAEWTYDTALSGKGMPATATRYVGDNAYVKRIAGYDARYHPLRTEVVIPAAERSLAGTYRYEARYNPDGSLASETYPAAGELPLEPVGHTYDDLGLPKTTFGGFGGTTFEYVLDSQHTRYGELQRLHLGERPRRAWLSYYYEDHTRRLKQTIADAEVPAPMLANTNYTYDPAGNVTSIADTVPGRPADTQCFRYDHLRRLSEAWTPTTGCTTNPNVAGLGGPAPYWHSFTFDEVGNRLTETQHAVGGDTQRTYAYEVPGHGHALASTTTRQPSGTTILDQYGYDDTGNTTGRNLGGSQQTLEWDAQNLLTKVTDGSGDTEFLYDADGERLIRREPGAITLFLSGQEIRLDRASNTKTGTRYYSHGGQVVAVRNGAGLSWLATDHQATAHLTINATSLQVGRRRLAPFGTPRGDAPATWPGSRAFVDGTLDPTTGLTHLGAREYDPSLGRFISVDPVLDLTDPQQMHGYTYSNNNPVTFSDPTGLMLDCGPNGKSCSSYEYEQTGGAGWGGGGGGSSTNAPVVTSDHPHYKGVHDPTSNKNWINEVQVPDGIDFDALQRHMAAMFADPSQRTLWDNGWTVDDPLANPNAVISMLMGLCNRHDCGGGRQVHEQLYQMYLRTLSPSDMIGAQGSGGGGGGMTAARFGVGAGAVSGRFIEVPTGVRRALCNSFTPDTPVLMADGTQKPIKDIRVGDKVLATDPETGRTSAQTVAATIVSVGEKNLVDLTIGSVTITATANHPFWLPTHHKWTPASEISSGDVLQTPNGTQFLATTTHPRTATLKVHNLTTTGEHTYYVLAGNTPVLVHNDNRQQDDNIGLGEGYTGRMDQFRMGRGVDFEIHVYYRGDEVGIFGSNGWFPKHGMSADVSVPESVENRLKGKAIEFMRSTKRIGPKGTEDISGDKWMRPRLTGGC
jgi:RHS repeat-associated protein